MGPGNPVEAMSDALGAALHRDLPDIEYETRDWAEYNKTKKDVRVKATRRPDTYDVNAILFPQTWGSTALGYGGLGGAAVTTSYTVIVYDHRHYCVYFGGSRLAYKRDMNDLSREGREKFMADIFTQNMASCKDAATRYV